MPEEVKFIVDYDPETMGTYMYDCGEDYEHTITISSARCGHYYTMLTTLSHEMVHMSFHRQKGDKWSHHSAEFRRRCKIVAFEMGFDGLEL